MRTYRPSQLLIAIICFITFSLSYQQAAFAQDTKSIIITGKITSQSGDAISGASVRVKGSTSGTSSNDTGEFTITVKNSKSILVITHVGYAEKEVAVKSKSVVNIVLEENKNELSQVVVIG